MRHLKALAVTVFVVAGLPVLLTGATTGKTPHPTVDIPAAAFTPLSLSEVPPSDPPAAMALTAPAVTRLPDQGIIWDNPTGAIPRPTSRPRVAQPAPKARVVTKPKVKPKSMRAPSTSHGANGRASWYCSSKYPTCVHGYPPGSMVAAACGKLRAAMGPHWRGKIVTVRNRNTGKTVTVKLVDWCGSKDKLIDLYYAPMTKLGGSGVLSVAVRW